MEEIKETTVTALLEYLQENMLTKEESKNFATKDDLKNELGELEDRIAIRFDALQGELTAIKARLDKIERNLNEDTNVLVVELEKLKKRIAVLERELQIRSAH